MKLDYDDLLAVVVHHEVGGRDDDILIVHENGALDIVPFQDLEPLQDPFTWPKYIGQARAISNLVSGHNIDGALRFLNMIVTGTIAAPSNSLAARAGAAAGRFINDLLIPKTPPTQE